MTITFRGGPLNGKVYDWNEPPTRILIPIMPPSVAPAFWDGHKPQDQSFQQAVYDQAYTNSPVYLYQGEE